MTYPPPSRILSSFKTDPRGDEESPRWCNHSPCFRASAHAAKRQSVCVYVRRGILRQIEWVCGGAIKLRHTSRRPPTPTLPHLQEISLPHADTQQLHIYGLVWYVCIRVFALEFVSVEILIQWFAVLEQVAPFNSAGLHLSLWQLMVAYPHT